MARRHRWAQPRAFAGARARPSAGEAPGTWARAPPRVVPPSALVGAHRRGLWHRHLDASRRSRATTLMAAAAAPRPPGRAFVGVGRRRESWAERRDAAGRATPAQAGRGHHPRSSGGPRVSEREGRMRRCRSPSSVPPWPRAASCEQPGSASTMAAAAAPAAAAAAAAVRSSAARRRVVVGGVMFCRTDCVGVGATDPHGPPTLEHSAPPLGKNGSRAPRSLPPRVPLRPGCSPWPTEQPSYHAGCTNHHFPWHPSARTIGGARRPRQKVCGRLLPVHPRTARAVAAAVAASNARADAAVAATATTTASECDQR